MEAQHLEQPLVVVLQVVEVLFFEDSLLPVKSGFALSWSSARG